MVHRIWQSIQRRKRKNKLVKKKNFDNKVNVVKPKKIKFRRKAIKEDVHPKILGALKAKPHLVFDKVLAARDKEGEASGLHMTKPAKGSSRAVLPAKNDHVAMVDGKTATMKGIVKMAHIEDKDVEVGQAQNRVEASAKVQKYATLVRDGKSGFKTNKNGVVPPVFKHGNKHTFIHAGHAEDVSHEQISQLTKTKHFPDGLSLDEISLASNPRQNYYSKSHIIHKHPLIKSLTKFRKETGISDLHRGNIGAWTHPHTGKQHLVIRDAGFDPSVAHHYGYNASASVSAKSNPTQVTKSLNIKTQTGHQYSLDVDPQQNQHHNINAKMPQNTKEKYSDVMHKMKIKRAEEKFNKNPPNTKEYNSLAKNHLKNNIDDAVFHAGQDAHYKYKIKKIVRKNNTKNINTNDAKIVRNRFLANKNNSVPWEVMNKAANIAGDNRKKG